MGRRSFIAATVAAVGIAARQRDYGPGAAPVRYPDPDIVTLDKRFAKYKLGPGYPFNRTHPGLQFSRGGSLEGDPGSAGARAPRAAWATPPGAAWWR